MAAPVEAKTQAAGVTAAVSGAALWLLGKYVFRGAVPDGVASMIYIAVPGVLAFAAAYLAPHQHRDAPPAVALPSSISLTEPQMDAVRGALASGRMEPAAADERLVPPAP